MNVKRGFKNTLIKCYFINEYHYVNREKIQLLNVTILMIDTVPTISYRLNIIYEN